LIIALQIIFSEQVFKNYHQVSIQTSLARPYNCFKASLDISHIHCIFSTQTITPSTTNVQVCIYMHIIFILL